MSALATHPDTSYEFTGLPGMLWNYIRVVTSSKPLIAPPQARMGRTVVVARNVAIKPRHVRSYRAICGIPESEALPHAFPHVLAMPLHMYVFTSPNFPVKVLGLIHLRNTIRYLQAIPNDARLTLKVECDTMRETASGQEFDVVTRAELNGVLAWEEISTMLAHRATPGQRPKIERGAPAQIQNEFKVSEDTGRRYARVSGDFNPIHLTARTAGWFGFKQAVAHGMWSMSRSLGAAHGQIPAVRVQVDTQFKLPLYLPSTVVFRCDPTAEQTRISLSSSKDRLHLATQVKPL